MLFISTLVKSIYSLALIILLLFSAILYINFDGSPWDKARFKNEVKKYVEEKFPELRDYKQTIHLSFKSGTYYSTVQTNTDITFTVSELKDGNLSNDYYAAIWGKEVSQSVLAKVKEIFDFNGKVDFYLSEYNENYIEEVVSKYETFPDYSRVSILFQDKSGIIIRSSFGYKPTEEINRKCYSVIQFIKDNKYYSDVDFIFSDDKVITITYSELMEMKSWVDFSDPKS
jgi:hypothetical protein